MRTINSFLFQILLLVLLLVSILVVIIGSIYVLCVEIKELTGIDVLERTKKNK